MAAPAPTPTHPSRRAQAIVGCAAAAWLGAVVYGFGALFDHASTPGAPPAPPPQWPAHAPLALHRENPTLLMFVHPGCPCTLASLRELERVLAKCDGRAAATVVFECDLARDADTTASPAWQIAARLPGARTLLDRGGAAARAFGIATSGSVVLYAPDGRLLFHGGITGSRGHEGDNPGAAAVVARIHDTRAPATAIAVFGCDLAAPPGSPSR